MILFRHPLPLLNFPCFTFETAHLLELSKSCMQAVQWKM